jgi:hypothetical protein
MLRSSVDQPVAFLATGCTRSIPGRELAATGVRLGRVFVSWRRTNGVVTT